MFNPTLYFHTLRYLRPIQVYDRIRHKLYRPKPKKGQIPPRRPISGTWRPSAQKIPSLVGPNHFRFLNEENEISSASDWNRAQWPKLWIYNAHYFEDLNAEGSSERLEWHQNLISRWIRENPAGSGIGWEPYPLSLRIVNWIKWALAGNTLPQNALESLALQARFLSRCLEYHLLGNHLLANAKALVFAGLFLEGNEAESWADRGMSILTREVPEQILKDGGHFERSPMYHSLILEDLLDLINLFECYGGIKSEKCLITGAARRMIPWLKFMTHPDGRISLFNDAAFGIAPCPTALYNYAERSGIHERDGSAGENGGSSSSIDTLSFDWGKLIHLKTSGYIRVENGPITAILDVGPVGPDYLPGHAHADTLSFELSFYDQRVVVDTGTSRYDEGSERLRQRGTAAHNTVVIDEKDSSEVWAGFRTARRAKPFGLDIKKTSDSALMVRCAHDGYNRLAGKPVHWREWHFGERSLKVRDYLLGRYHEAIGRLHFHPGTAINGDDTRFSISLPDKTELSCRIKNGKGRVAQTSYHPEFGLAIPNYCLEMLFTKPDMSVVFSW